VRDRHSRMADIPFSWMKRHGRCQGDLGIVVAHQIGWCRIPWECLHDLLRQPLYRRVPGHREPEQLSSTVAHDEKSK
jgi:hypothetical protein